MLSIFRKTGIEITSKGIYAVSKGPVSDVKKDFFSSLEEFLNSELSKGSVSVALSRDVLFVRKITLPTQALEDLQESLYYSSEELFPIRDLFVKGHPLSVGKEKSEVMVWALREDVYETLAGLKNVKVILPTPYLYRSFFEGDRFIRKLGDAFELNEYEGDRLMDSLLVKEGKPNLPEDEFLGAELSLKLLLNDLRPEFYFLDRRRLLNKKTVRLGIAVAFLCFLIIALGYRDVSHLRKEIEEIKSQTSKLMPMVDEYNRILDEIEFKKKLLELSKTQRSNVLGILRDITHLLPKDTWLKSFSYKGNIILLEGYTSSTTNLLRRLQDSGKFSSINLRGTPKRSGSNELFRIELKLGR